MVKDVQIYIYWVKKKTCLGSFRIEEIRDKDNETGLKEGGGIEMSTTVLSIYAMLLRLKITYPVCLPYPEKNETHERMIL